MYSTQHTHKENVATVRQSDRLKTQTSYGMKIADKASHLQEKNNLEGTHYDSQNSFAVLNNHELISRVSNMGINTDFMNSESFDLLRDLERARANLKLKTNNAGNIPSIEEDSDLPFVEMKFLDWKTDNSDDDGFQIVSSRKKKRVKKITMNRKRVNTREGLHSLNEVSTPEGGKSKICTGYNLRKGKHSKTIQL